MNVRGQAKVYYLYMMSDGEVSKNEKSLFNAICKELHLDTEQKKEIIKECEDIVIKERYRCIDVLRKNARESYVSGILDLDLDKCATEADKTTFIWNLINLGYADAYYTKVEQEIVNFLCEYWAINDSIYQEMIDVAETVVVLEKHREWIENEWDESEEKQHKLKSIKKDIKYVYSTISTTISEII